MKRVDNKTVTRISGRSMFSVLGFIGAIYVVICGFVAIHVANDQAPTGSRTLLGIQKERSDPEPSNGLRASKFDLQKTFGKIHVQNKHVRDTHPEESQKLNTIVEDTSTKSQRGEVPSKTQTGDKSPLHYSSNFTSDQWGAFGKTHVDDKRDTENHPEEKPFSNRRFKAYNGTSTKTQPGEAPPKTEGQAKNRPLVRDPSWWNKSKEMEHSYQKDELRNSSAMVARQTSKPPNQQQALEGGAQPQRSAPLKKNKAKKRRPTGDKFNPHAHDVEPEVWLVPNASQGGNKGDTQPKSIPSDQILSLYLEPVDQSTWDVIPYPMRNTTAKKLSKRSFPRLDSCRKLPEQWPVDEFPDDDPYLPWIHDVFPTYDGKYIQFVAQNKLRCHTGQTEEEARIVNQTKPQVALFQHVPIKKLDDLSTASNPRFRLASHEDADPEAINTRFLCRFKPSGDVTFSEFNHDYEWAAVRKRYPKMFSENGRDNWQIHTSQLLFKCPVPNHLVEEIRTGASVQNDWATLFVDLIPIRTPPRYGNPKEFLQPYYQEGIGPNTFDPDTAWGRHHILPLIQDSGRWENIPICQNSLMTYEPKALDGSNQLNVSSQVAIATPRAPKHRLVSCLWASAGYATRGNRYAINDGQRRLMEWVTFNKMLGFDHFYIYDNSAAFTNKTSLQAISEFFPDDVTVINWPSRVCNNNQNFADSVGERSSQYAAEASCRLRFGPHTEWIGQFDIDEYLVPMGDHNSLLPILDKLDGEGTKILNFASWRAWPRRTHINDPVTLRGFQHCGRKRECFELSVRDDTSILEAYNCDRQKPGQKTMTMPAEKQLYRPDYVTQHFIHYSTITETSNMRKPDFEAKFGDRRLFPDPLARFVDEVEEALMLHSKAVARQDTAGWVLNCNENSTGFDTCRIGFPWPEDEQRGNETTDAEGWKYNCYINPKIERVWAPRLQAELKKRGFL